MTDPERDTDPADGPPTLADLVWRCDSCGHEELAALTYDVGDVEDCLECDHGTATVMHAADLDAIDADLDECGGES
jgi:hypothetical protein